MLRLELSSFTVYWRLVWCLGTRKRMYSVLWLGALSIFAVNYSSATDMVRTLPDSQDVVEGSPWIRLPKILYAATFPLPLASRVWPLGILGELLYHKRNKFCKKKKKRQKMGVFQRRHIYGEQKHERMFNTANHQRSANQSHSEILPHICQNDYQKKSTNVGEDVEKPESLYTAGENVNWCSHDGKYYGNCSKN